MYSSQTAQQVFIFTFPKAGFKYNLRESVRIIETRDGLGQIGVCRPGAGDERADGLDKGLDKGVEHAS